MSGPIVRTGTTPKFWKNWDNIFGGKKATEKSAEAPKAKAEKKETKSAKKPAAKKSTKTKAAKKKK